MKIVSPFLPQQAGQPLARPDNSSPQVEPTKAPVESTVSAGDVPRFVSGEVETVFERALSRRDVIDLRGFKGTPLPFNKGHALSSYLRVAGESVESVDAGANLDIFA